MGAQLIGFGLKVVFLRLTAAVVPRMKIEAWGTALIAVVLMMWAGWLTDPLFVFLPQGSLSTYAFVLVLRNAVTLSLASLMLDRMEVSGFGTLLLGSVLLTLFELIPFFVGTHLTRTGQAS